MKLLPNISKHIICDGFFVGTIFLPIAIKMKRGRAPIQSKRFKWLSQIPKKGTYIVSILVPDMDQTAGHAIVYKNGHVLDSHYEIGIPLEYYKNHRIQKGICYKIA